MSDDLSADDLAILASSFRAAVSADGSVGETNAALFDLGWADVLAAAPTRGAKAAFTALGATGSGVSLLDDVVAQALGFDPSLALAVVFPAPASWSAPATAAGESIVVDGILSTRSLRAEKLIVVVNDGPSIGVVSIDPKILGPVPAVALDPDRPYWTISRTISATDATVLDRDNGVAAWDRAVSAARIALAHQMIAAARWVVDTAKEHAVDRVQFGRSIASFQAVRHKLAEAYVQIESAAAVADSCHDDCDPLLTTTAKSLSGQAGRLASANGQQVLAGIGFTTDHDFHRWLKRLMVLDTLFGSAQTLPLEIGLELLKREEAPRLVEL